jgi:hypothetical protein
MSVSQVVAGSDLLSECKLIEEAAIGWRRQRRPCACTDHGVVAKMMSTQ